ncbi:hypothetical protein ACFKAH_003479 [Vibrio parahaemolyticus]|uniref:hypothetical protein n=1 Tax=Vibrio parahaemolyticus TaxID=670 RepID=UPI0029E6423D|nr:hypothetical protein [Vibrio parahaemolyticus]EJG0023403.1 hypothetical protein [Vibrio parahaemolyticus]
MKIESINILTNHLKPDKINKIENCNALHCLSQENPVQEEFMLRAYSQNHYSNKEDFLAAILPFIGEGLLLDLHSKMIDKYGMPKLGTSRVSYVSKKAVFKVPISQDGFKYNDFELSLLSSNIEGGAVYGHTRLAKPMGIDVIAMEIIERAEIEDIESRLGSVPDWIYEIDMGQVGFNSKGVLKAYDYADILDRLY